MSAKKKKPGNDKKPRAKDAPAAWLRGGAGSHGAQKYTKKQRRLAKEEIKDAD